MKISDLLKRPSKAKPPLKQLKATARRAEIVSDESYDDDEPNVRLSRAFLVVMLLHVVAVGGIFAFSSFKKENETNVPAQETKITSQPAQDSSADSRIYVVNGGDTLASIATSFGVSQQDLQAANKFDSNYKVDDGDKLIIPEKSAAEPAPLDAHKLMKLSQSNPPSAVRPPILTKANPVEKAAETPVAATDQSYVVQKGDNPVGIAKKLNVKYADLIKANNITDPRKLQIGQKLVVPQ